MKLSQHKALDALVAQYILGTMRGAARRRFERAMRDEPLVATRVNYWLQRANLKPSEAHAVQPSPQVWKAIERDLNLARFRPPWYARVNVLRNWAFAATAALMLFIAGQWIVPTLIQPELQSVARLSGSDQIIAGTTVTASRSRDGKRLSLKSDRAVVASAQQSYELWLLPENGAAPISLAVLGSLDATFDVPAAQVGRVSRGAKLAVSVEPAGGSKTGAPTGPVILVGAIDS
ncbi:MAG: anti-sigma factor [Casimicrobium sp.]